MRLISRIMVGLLVLGLVAFSVSTPVYAAGTIQVNTTVDQDGTGTGCSVREAVTSANTDADFGGCTRVGTPPYTINVPAGFYVLNNAVATGLTINVPMEIVGAGHFTTLIAAAATPNTVGYRVFTVPAGGNLTLRTAGILYGGNGSVDFGGGIYVQAGANATLDRVLVYGNTAQYGGGVAVRGTATLTTSVITVNTATIDVAGIGVDGAGASATLTNVGIAENNAVGGAGGLTVSNGASVTGSTVGIIDNTTALGAGGVLVQDGGSSLTLTNATIEFNTGANGSAIIGSTGANVSITNSCVVGNEPDTAVITGRGSATMTLTGNWWGDAAGPYLASAPTPTAGDSVDDSVNFAGFQVSAPATCGTCTVVSSVSDGRSLRTCSPPAGGYPQPLS